MRSRFAAAVLTALAAVSLSAATPAVATGGGGGKGPGVYLKLVDALQIPFPEVTAAMTTALEQSGWTVAGEFAASADPEACTFRAEVLVAYRQDWVDRVMKSGTDAAFAVPIRFVVWEDENGVSVGATNPMNLARTMVDESTAPESWRDMATEIRAVAALAFRGKTVDADYGQHREKARIGRTLGIMAGGKFTDKVETVATLSAEGTDPSAVAHRLAEGIPTVEGTWEWGAEPVYVIDLPQYGASLVGIAGAPMEAKAFGIVKHGGDDARKKMACPGVDHAAAFPIELLVARDGDDIKVSLVDEMYRMKMFFEDAGKMAFAKNMGMPGSIEDEIRKKVEAALQ